MTTFADIIAQITARLERNAAFDAGGNDSYEAGRKDSYSYAAQIVKEVAASHDLRAAALATLDSTDSGEDMAASIRYPWRRLPWVSADTYAQLEREYAAQLGGEEPQKEDKA